MGAARGAGFGSAGEAGVAGAANEGPVMALPESVQVSGET